MRRPLFAIKPGEKTPIEKNYKATATTSEATLRKWHDAGFNLGYLPVTGGETVIDLDKHNGKNGGAELKALADSLGQKFPETYTVRTPTGGCHLYFKGLAPYDKLGFLPGVDVMCRKRYVVAVGSFTKDGAYDTVVDKEPADLPQWFIDEMVRRKGGKKAESTSSPGLNVRIDPDTPDKIAHAIEIITSWDETYEGGRNDALNRMAYDLCKAGVSEEKALELYIEYGIDRLHYGTDEKELEEVKSTIHSSYNGKMDEFGSTSAQALIERFDRLEEKESDAEDWDDMENAVVPDRKWFIRDWLLFEPGTILLFSGQGGTGKSLLGLMLAYCLATGEPWLDMKVERRAKSFIVSCEDSRDEQARRIQRVKKLYGHGSGKGLIKVWCRAGEDNVLARATYMGLITETKFMEALKTRCAEHFGQDGGILILDTLSDFVAINENDRMQVSQFIKHHLARFAQDLGITVILLAHPNKSNMGYSGSTAWEAAARSRWELAWETEKDKKATGNLVLTLGKANSAMRGKEILLRYGDDFLPHVTTRAEKSRELEDLLVKMIGDAEEEGNPFGRTSTSLRPIVAAEIEDPASGLLLKKDEIKNLVDELLASGAVHVITTKKQNYLSIKPPAPGKED